MPAAELCAWCWFAESIARDGSGYPGYETWQITVWPISVRSEETGQYVSDWCTFANHGEHSQFRFQNSLSGIIAALVKIAEEIEGDDHP
jgi:hypothetical protein